MHKSSQYYCTEKCATISFGARPLHRWILLSFPTISTLCYAYSQQNLKKHTDRSTTSQKLRVSDQLFGFRGLLEDFGSRWGLSSSPCVSKKHVKPLHLGRATASTERTKSVTVSIKEPLKLLNKIPSYTKFNNTFLETCFVHYNIILMFEIRVVRLTVLVCIAK